MLEVLAARNYFETHGSFTEIRHDLGQRVANMTEEDLYASIGFLPYKKFSGKQIFMIRKLYLQGDIEQAMKRSGCETKLDLIRFLTESYNHFIEEEVSVLLDYAELITSYVIKSLCRILEKDANNADLISSFYQECLIARESDNPFALKKSQKEMFDMFLELFMPRIKVVKGVEPKIVGGVMYIPRALNQKQYKNLEQHVVLSFIMGVTEVPALVVANYRDYAIGQNYTDLLLSPSKQLRDLYTYILDLSLRKETTIESVLNAMGMNLIHYWRQYKESKCMYILKNENSVVVKYESGEKIVDFPVFLQLYKNDDLLLYENRR